MPRDDRVRLTDHPAWSAAVGAALGIVAVAVLAQAGLLPSSGAPPPARAGSSAPGSAAPGSAAPGSAGPGAAAGAPASPAPPAPAGSAAAFLAAWRAHLMANWSVDEIDERTTTAGAVVRFQIHSAQAPPDSVVIGNGTVAARRGSVELGCGPGASGVGLTCRTASAPRTWQQDVDRQIAALASEVSGPRALYAVTSTRDGCWSLVLKVPGTLVPVGLGRSATYCLDAATGALRSSVIQRVGAVDRVTAVSFHSPATAADLALPAGATITP